MHRIVINQMCTLGAKTGIGHYTEQLLSHLRRSPTEGLKVCAFPTGLTRLRLQVARTSWMAVTRIRNSVNVPPSVETPEARPSLAATLRSAFWTSVKAVSKRARAVACNQIEGQ